MSEEIRDAAVAIVGPTQDGGVGEQDHAHHQDGCADVGDLSESGAGELSSRRDTPCHDLLLQISIAQHG